MKFYFDKFMICAIVRFLIRPIFATNNTYSVQICNFDNYVKIFPFLSQRWLSARKELNLTCKSDDESSSILKDRHDAMVTNFFRFSSQVPVFNINQSIIGYGRIYKCASEGIMHNLNLYAREISLYEAGKEHVLLNRDDITDINHAIQYNEKDNFEPTFNSKIWNLTKELKSRNKNFKIFTFIRDPLKHFESGFREAVYRTKGLVLTSTESITNIIRDMLDYVFISDPHKPLNDLFHIFRMSGVYFNYNIDLTLHVETFVDDWETIVVPTYYLPPKTFDAQSGFHETSVDHPRVKSHEKIAIFQINNSNSTQIQELFKYLQKTQPSTMRAICHLILIDYICFPEYKLPRSCTFLKNVFNKGKQLLTS